jgi:hypothetical protein
MNRIAAAVLACAFTTCAFADEGMWTIDNFPAMPVKQKYGVDIGRPWLDRLQRSITRHETGCTGSFASSDGLVLTNHHCVMDCLSELSSANENRVEKVSGRTGAAPS